MNRLVWIGLVLAMPIGSAIAQTSTQTGTQTNAQTNSLEYTFLVASGFLCNSGNAGACPAVARSGNGDAFELSGVGTFSPHEKTARAFGVFNHKSASGDLLETGIWTVDRMISFESYGVAPAALAQWGPAVGRPYFGPPRPGRSGRMPIGGLAVFRVLLTPVSGSTKGAELQVNCALGAVPEQRSVEGIRITLDKDKIEYTEEAGARVVFLTAAREARVPARSTDEKARAGASGESQGDAPE
jgi:hypothetical protein